MTHIKKIFAKRLYIPIYIALPLLFISSLAATWLMFRIQPNGTPEVIELFKRSGFVIPLLNFLPVLLCMLLLFFVTGSLTASAGAVGAVVTALSFVNRYKLAYRNDPFIYYDIALAPELMGVIKSFGARFITGVIAAVVFGAAFCVLAVYFVRTRPMPPLVRGVGAAVLTVVILAVNNTVYKNADLYRSQPVIGNIYNDKDIFLSRGFLYCFIHTFNTIRVVKPEGYDKTAVERELGSLEIASQDARLAAAVGGQSPADFMPNIIIIMSEAFSELSLNPAFSFDGFIDPLENYKKIKQDSFSGTLVAPNYGGGTGDTEFDVLTGGSARFLRGAPFVYRLIKNGIEALPGLLGQAGYTAEAIHPGYGWFYNRQNVFKYMGFEAFYDLKYFESANKSRAGYITDEACFDFLIKHYQNKSENPLFTFVITIEGHGPYDTVEGTDKNFEIGLTLSDGDINALRDYFERVKAADIQLRRLVDFLENDDEPVILLFFGDHLPAFQPSVLDAVYGSLQYAIGSAEERLALYTPPFFIWQNKKARAAGVVQGSLDRIFGDGEVLLSSYYLGALLMEITGNEHLSPLFDYVNALREDYPVVLENEYYTKDGGPFPIDTESPLTLYRDFTYYLVMDSK